MASRVLQIIPSLDRGGAEKQLVLLATGLPRDRFDVHVCVLTRSGPWEPVLRRASLPLHFINKRWKADPAAYLRMERLIRRLRPDLVHTWIFAANAYGRQAAVRAGVKRIVAGERCVDLWKASYELAIDRRLARRTDCIVTNSSGVRDFYTQQGIPADKFEIIPNGIAPGTPGDGSRQDLLHKLGLPDDARLIGAVGRLWPQKRYKDLLWATELLRVARGDAHLLIIGDGPQLARLMRFRDQIGSHTHAHFLGQRNDVLRILPHLDCFWLGSGYEGQSNALMEAMLAGVPAVATDIPGNRDLVLDGESGFLVPVGDRAAFAKQTNLLLDDHDLARRLGTQARQRILRDFTVENMVQRHVALYERLLDDTSSVPRGRS